MSPDRKWIWDGAQWRPIAVHEAAFPSWKSLGAGFTPETAAQAAPLSGAPPATRREPPTPAYRLAGPAPDIGVPRWSRKPAGARIQRYGLIAAAAAGVIIVVALVSGMGTLALSSKQSPPAPNVSATPSAGPETRSDSGRATFLVKTLDPAVADLNDNTAQMRASCRVGMTSSCADSLVAIENSLALILPLLDKTTIPLCIAAQEAPLRADLANINAGEQLAFKGYKDNRKSEFSSGLAQASAASVRVPSEYAGMKKAVAACSSDVTGP